MSEKYFTITEEGTNKQFKAIMSYNSSTIDIELQNKDNPKEKYEIKNLTLAYFHKIKNYQKLDTIKLIADLISKQLENKNFLLRTGALLDIKFVSPSETSYAPLVLKKVGNITSGVTSSGSNSEVQLREEIARLRKENLDLRAQLEKVSSSPSNPVKKPTTNAKVPQKTTLPPQPKASTTSNYPPKTNPPPPQKTSPKPPLVDTKSSNPSIQIVGSYIPPSMNKKGNIFDRIAQTIKLKNDMKKTLDEIFNRLNDVKARIDNFVNKAFANNPTPEDKKKALNLITEVLLLRQGFKDIDNYQEIFQNEVKEKGIKFSANDKEKFDDSMLILGKSFPYSLTPYHQKINHLLIQTIHDFFIEKNLRFYKPKELEEVQKMREKLK